MKKIEYLVVGGIAFLFSFIIMTITWELPYFGYWFVFIPAIGVFIGLIINNYYQQEPPILDNDKSL